MTRNIFIFLLALLLSIDVVAQTVRINAPASVATGENFRVEYIVDTDDVSDFRMGNLPDGLVDVAGPYTSTQSNFQFINGHSISSSSTKITFVINAAKPGNYVIPCPLIRACGKNLNTQPHKVRVSGCAQGNSGQGQTSPRMHQRQENEHVQATVADTKDVFIRVTASRNSVVEQEPIKLTYKLYKQGPITVPSDLKIPNVQDFTIYEIEGPTTVEWERESLNGKIYDVIVWKQYMVYPQTTGALTVPGSSVKINRVIRNHNVDPIEQFFNPSSSYREAEMDVTVPSITINVSKLPNRPANFSGGVGVFSMNAVLSKKELKAGEPVTVKVTVSGSGNMKLLKKPIVKFPDDFEVYDPKVIDRTKNTGSGVEGSMTYDFIAVPQNKGKFVLPPVEFTYFDVNTREYNTLKSEQMTVNVLPSDNSGSSEEDYQEQLRNTDIYSIKSISDISSRQDDGFFMSISYVVMLCLLFASFVALLFIFRRRAIERADVVRLKANRANKVANKRLKKAAILLRDKKKEDFYDEVLRTLWGYAADKINIPVEELSKENIAEKLTGRGCNSFSVGKFTSAIEECEYARYAPSTDEISNMNNTFEMAVTGIMEIEESLKGKVRPANENKVTNLGSGMNGLLLFLLLSIAFILQPSSSLASTTIETANSAYSSGNYEQAATLYEQVLRVGESAEVYYNLGNAYYRMNKLEKASLCYERAYLLDPTDNEIKHNLEFIATKTIDHYVSGNEMFFVTWYRNISYLFTIYGWAVFSLLMMALSLVGLLVYLFTALMALRRISFYTTFVSFLLFLCSVGLAFQQKCFIEGDKGAIVTAEEIQVRKKPEMHSDNVVAIHKGTHIDIIDDAMQDWKEIELPDGKTGWIPANTFERVVK